MREPSPLELAEDLKDLTTAIREHTKQVNARFDGLAGTFIPREVYEAYHAALRQEVARLDNKLTWATRAAVTGILFPVVVSVIVALVLLVGAPS